MSKPRRALSNALLQWEDFAPDNGRRILEKYRDQICTFNDDMQGTGAITLAAAISAVRVCGTPLRNQRVVIFGAGTAGIGVADQICDAMVREGFPKKRQPGASGASTGRDCLPPIWTSGCATISRHTPARRRKQKLDARRRRTTELAWPKSFAG